MVVPFSFLNKKNQNKTSSENVQELTKKLMSVFQVQCNMPNTRNSVSSGYPNTERRVKNTTGSGVFLTKFEVFG